MKNPPPNTPKMSRLFSSKVSLMAGFVLGIPLMAMAAADTWNGGGADDNWSSSANWDNLPAAGDSLIFDGSTRLTPNNDFTAGTAFSGISFASGASAFTLGGNSVLLSGQAAGNVVGVANNSFNAQINNLTLSLDWGLHAFNSPSSTLALNGGVTRYAGSLAYFGDNLTSSSLVVDGNGLINGLGGAGLMMNPAGAFINLATVSGGSILAYDYSTDAHAQVLSVGGTGVITSGADQNVDLINSAAQTYTLSADTLVNTILTEQNVQNVNTINLNGHKLTVGTVGGIFATFGGNTTSANKNIITVSGGGASAISAGGSVAGTPGTLIFGVNGGSTGNQMAITASGGIVDNGSGAVTVIKTGSGSMYFNIANSYSGGTYVNQGYLQVNNAASFGTGPVYIAGGATLFPNANNAVFTNDISISPGLGVSYNANVGAIKLAQASIKLSGELTMLGDPVTNGPGCRITGNNNTGVYTFAGKITGSGTLNLNSFNSGPAFIISNVTANANDWTGGLILNENNNSSLYVKLGGNNQLASNNVTLVQAGTGVARLDVNGNNDAMGGLIAGASVNNQVANYGAAPSVLTLGANDATAAFGGILADAGSPNTLSIVKAGNGAQTLTGANTYSGNTTISAGTLALGVGGSIASSPNININNTGNFDVSAVCPLALGAGQMISFTNGALTVALQSAANAVTATTLTVDGAVTINVDSMPPVVTYPQQFTAIKYTTKNGSASFVLGALPATVTVPYQGYVLDNVGNGSIDVVITNGPGTLTWVGYSGGSPNSSWNTSTANWRTSGGGSALFVNGLPVNFDDSASNAVVSLDEVVSPDGLSVSNSALNYTISGANYISGSGGLTKQGPGTLILDNSGVNDFSGGVTVSGGILQVGNNDSSGNLPATGSVEVDGALNFARADNVTVSNVVTGLGVMTNTSSGVLTLAGANTFDGTIVVAQGTLQVANNSALGSTVGGTIVEDGATLDVNGVAGNTRRIGAEPITVSGAGIGAAGAIVNNGSDAYPTMSDVTLAGNTTVGGAGRWDIRPATGTDPGTGYISTSGHAYSLTKVGGNFFGVANTTIDSALGDVNVQAGTFNFEGNTTGLGNPANTLTIGSGATFELYNATNHLDKHITVDDSGYILNGAGANTIVGPVTLVDVGFINVNGVSLTLAGTLSGAGIMSLNGTGQLIVNGDGSAFTGSENLNYGSLALNGVLGGSLVGYPNTVFSGTGTNLGSADIYGGIVPGGAGVPGILTVGSLALESGATNLFDLSATNTANGGNNDLVRVSGDLTGNGNTITVNFTGGKLSAGVYKLFTYSGSLVNGTGTFNPTVATTGGASRYVLTLDYSTPGEVDLIVSGGPANLVWNSTGSADWDTVISQNWSNMTTHVSPDYFYAADNVLFDDTPGVVTNINLSGTVSPTVLTNNSSINNFNIGGTGKISGTADIVKLGTGTLTISNTNDFIGDVNVKEGTLHIATANALGTADGSTIISSNATLDINGVGNVLINEPVVVAGPGVGGMGAIINYGAADINGFKSVTLAGDTTFGGPVTDPNTANWGRWDIRTGTLSTSSNAYNLTKVGPNQISIVGSTVDSALADITVNGGVLSYETTTTELGNPTNTLTVNSPGQFQFWNSTVPLNKVMVLNGDGTNQVLRAGQGHQEDGENTISGSSVTLNGVVTVGFGGQNGGDDLTVMSPVIGTGSLTMEGAAASEFRLYGTNTYSGNTWIDVGLMFLVNTGSIGESSNILISAGASLVANTRTDGTLTLNGAIGQTLRGAGTVQGIVNASNGNVAPGNPDGTPTGTLTITTNITLGGMTTMEVDNAGPASDKLVSTTGTITFGGDLVVTNIGGVLTNGDSFDLFDGTLAGTFAAVTLPVLSSGLVWNTNQLATTGVISVGSAVNINPTNIVFSISSNQLVLSWSADHTGWYLQVQTNSLSAGLGTNWVTIPNSNLSNGYTNTVDATKGTVFYRMVSP